MKKLYSFLLIVFIASQLWGQNRNRIYDLEDVNIENKAVQDYMADALATYSSNSDYRVSVITKYNNSDIYGTKLYWPAGKEVKWTPSATDFAEVRISASEYRDFRNAFTYFPQSKEDSTYIIRNLLPGRIYYYKVEEISNDGRATRKASGVFRTTGQVRMIWVPNNANLRDIGGWNTCYGKPIKYGRLYRSGSLERITKEGRHAFVDNLGVVAELDLRNETRRTTSCLGDDKDYLRISHGMYKSGMTERSSVYPRDLRWIIARLDEGKSLDWHCAIGCDRCGTLSFLIEGLLGMSELDICRDYELSTLSLSSKNKRVRSPLKSMFKYIKQFGDEDNLAQCFYNYWISLGMKREELDHFIAVMVDVPNVSQITRSY